MSPNPFNQLIKIKRKDIGGRISLISENTKEKLIGLFRKENLNEDIIRELKNTFFEIDRNIFSKINYITMALIICTRDEIKDLEDKIGESDPVFKSKRIYPIILQMVYLYWVEVIYTSLIDIIIFAMIKQGHDLYNDYNRRYIHKFQELSQITLNSKQKFLNEHEFNEISNICNRKLRNIIAHQNFRQEENMLFSSEGNKINLWEEYIRILKGSSTIKAIIFQGLRI